MEIKKMALEDIDTIYEIECLSCSYPWSKESLIEELDNTRAVYIVAKEKDIILGYISMWIVLDEGQINNFAVHPNYRDRGIGSKLLESAIFLAKNHPLQSLTLEVRISNEKAQDLYKKYDFEEVGVRKGFYTKPVEDAIIMTLDWGGMQWIQ